MKDYTVTVKVAIAITARSMPQAQERAERLETAAAEGLGRLMRWPWLGNVEAPESEVEENQ